MFLGSAAQRSIADRVRGLPLVLRCGATLCLVVFATWISLRFSRPYYSPEWFLEPLALMLATWYLGKGPGWLAFVTSALATQYYFIPPFRSLRVGWEDIPFFASFLACEVLAGLAANRRYRTELHLREINDVLVAKERAETSLSEANLEVARLMRVAAVAEMAAAIAHEVNQPLAAIVANADACEAWLSTEPANLDEARSAAERAVKGATRATEVIGRIRGMMTRSDVKRSQVNLNTVIRTAVELSSYRHKDNRTIVNTQLCSLPEALLDEVQMQQVILNLLSNAIEATAELDRKASVSITSSVQDGDLRVSVSDNGHGVANAEVENLFKPFYTTRKTGVGVGLSISRSIVEAHGGRLWAQRNQNHGLTFHMSVPVGG